MDKNKSEKLKEILNQTISQEEIEAKLTKEIELMALKKAKEKANEQGEIRKANEQGEIRKANEQGEIRKANEQGEIRKANEQGEIRKQKNNIKVEMQNADIQKQKVNKQFVKIKTITKNEKTPKDKSKEIKRKSSNINMLLYIVSSIAILLFLVVVYLFIKKEKLIYSNLAADNKKIEIKKEKNKNIVKIEENIKKEEKRKEVIKEKIVTKVINLEKKDFKSYYNSSKFNTLKCYDFKAGNVFPTVLCKNNIDKFLEENKNSLRFEIIPVIAENDNIIFDKIQPNIKNIDMTFQEKVKKYLYRGLSRERVLETTWYITNILGEDTILTPTNYYVKSKKNNKGVIIKAYH